MCHGNNYLNFKQIKPLSRKNIIKLSLAVNKYPHFINQLRQHNIKQQEDAEKLELKSIIKKKQ